MQEEIGSLIKKLPEGREIDNITLGARREQGIEKSREKNKQETKLKPDASRTESKQYIKNMVSLLKDNTHKDAKIGLVGNERKSAGN